MRLGKLSIAMLVCLAGSGCSESDDIDPALYAGLWCGVGENVPDDGSWCLLVCETDRATISDQLQRVPPEPENQYLRYRYDGSTLTLIYRDESKFRLEFVVTGGSATIELPGEPTAFTAERVARDHELCTSADAKQYDSPFS
jgi:hypothetical protein